MQYQASGFETGGDAAIAPLMRYYIYDAAAKKPAGPFAPQELKAHPLYGPQCYLCEENSAVLQWRHPGEMASLAAFLNPVPPPATQSPAPATSRTDENKHILAGLPRRFAALFIDIFLLYSTVYIFLELLVRCLPHSLKLFNAMPATPEWELLFIFLPIAVCGLFPALLYFPFLNSRFGKGQTIGERRLGIRVTGRNGEPVSYLRSFLRECILLLPLLCMIMLISFPIYWVVWCLSGYILVPIACLVAINIAPLYFIFFNRRTGQGLHDCLTGSYVIKTGEEKNIGDLPPVWRGHYAIAALFVVSAILAAILFFQDLPKDGFGL